MIVGWREWVSLPGVGVPWVKAKLDSGARTSSIHAFNIEEFVRDDTFWVRFQIHPWQRSHNDSVTVELPVLEMRNIRSSNGQVQHRMTVLVDVSIAGRVQPVEMTLSNRDEMGFRILIGRQALRQGYLVDSGLSYAGGRPVPSIRKKNRSR